MGKIKRTPTRKHLLSQPRYVRDFVRHRTTAVALHDLPSRLAEFPTHWEFPRGDLHHWIPLLNRFDTILEGFVEKYQLKDGPQRQKFTRALLKGEKAASLNIGPVDAVDDETLTKLGYGPDGDRQLVEAVLRFTERLFEHCGSRSIYVSSGHLDSLLNTHSLSLLDATLRLCLQLAQRYSSARRSGDPHMSENLLQTYYQVDLKKLQRLAAPDYNWPLEASKTTSQTRSEEDRPSVDYLELIHSKVLSAQDWQDIVYSFIGVVPATFTHEGTGHASPSPASPSPAGRSRSEDASAQSTASLLAVEPRATSKILLDETALSKDDTLDAILNKPIEDLVSGTMAAMSEQSASEKYAALDMIRLAKALLDSPAARQDLAATRLLAVANLAYIMSDSALSDALQFEADAPRHLRLPNQLCRLVHPLGNDQQALPKRFQTLALRTLTALCKHKSRINDVSTALNVNVNHGVLSFVTRKAVAELGSEIDPQHMQEDSDWRESIFGLLHELPRANSRNAEAIISAGLLEILVEALGYRTRKALYNHPRVLDFFDVFTYNKRETLRSLASANGPEAISELLSHEVEVSLEAVERGDVYPDEFKTRNVDFQLPAQHQQVIHSALNLVNHMVINNQGAFDRQLRNVMESSKHLEALKHIVTRPQEFGSILWKDALQVFSNFLHSEPTSFSAMSEMGLTKAVLEVVTGKPIPSLEELSSSTPDAASRINPAVSILPSAVAISSLPDAISAICLNETGLKQVQSSEVLGAFFATFLSAPHVRALTDSSPEEQLEELGASFDELARHHPSLKPVIIRKVSQITTQLAELLCHGSFRDRSDALIFPRPRQDQIISEAFKAEAALQRLSIPETLRTNEDQSVVEDVEMSDIPRSVEQLNAQASKLRQPVSDPNQIHASNADYITVFSRFLFGLFGNSAQSLSFLLETSAFEKLLDMTTCPNLPPDFNNSASMTNSKLIMVFQLLVEQKPHLTLPSVVARACRELDGLTHFMLYSGDKPYFAPFFADDPDALSSVERERKATGSATAQGLIHIQTLCSILSKGLTPHSSRNATSLLSSVNLADAYMQLIDRLGRLLRKSTFENALLSTTIPPSFKNRAVPGAAQYTDSQQTLTSVSQTASVTQDAQLSAHDQANTTSNEAEPLSANLNLRSSTDPKFSHRAVYNDADYNYACARHMIHNCSKTFTAVMTTIGRMLFVRRMPTESYVRQNTLAIADTIGEALVAQIPQVEASSFESNGRALLVFYENCVMNIARSLTERKSELEDWTTWPILTLIVQAFKKKGGILKLGEMLQALVAARTKSTSEDGEKAAPRAMLPMPHSMILKLFSLLVNDKKLAGSAQTAGMSSRHDRERDKPDYFSPSQFAVELRFEAATAVGQIWKSEDQIANLDIPSIKLLLCVLKFIFEADGEQSAFRAENGIRLSKESPRRAWRLRTSDQLDRVEERGFTRQLCMEALYRCNENHQHAIEYCQKYNDDPSAVRNPIPSYDDNPPEAVANVPQPSAGSSGNETSQHQEISSPQPEDSAGSTLPAPADGLRDPPPAPPMPVMSNADDEIHLEQAPSNNKLAITADDLDKLRSDLKIDLIKKCLGLLFASADVTFELADLILASTLKASDPGCDGRNVCTTLIQALADTGPNSNSLQENGRRVEACAHLLGIILQDQEVFRAASNDLRDAFSKLTTFIVIPADLRQGDSPAWIAPVLLVLERVLAEDAQPEQIQWSPPTINAPADEPIAQLRQALVSEDDRLNLFARVLEVLPRIGKNAKLGLAIARILVPLTRNRAMATRLGSRKNLQRLFVMVKQLSGFVDEKFQTAFMLILRHIVEDEATIRQIMRSEITNFFEKQSRSQVDTTVYTRPLAHLIIRAPDVFVEVTNELVTLPKFDRTQNPQQLVLKRGSPEVINSEGAHDGDPALGNNDELVKPQSDAEGKMDLDQHDSKAKSAEIGFPAIENPDGILHFILSELLAYKDIDDKDPGSSNEKITSGTSDGASVETQPSPADTDARTNLTPQQETFKAEEHPIFMYRALLLQATTELLKSYNRTKLEFISYSRRTEAQSSTPSKPRSGVLNYLLNGIIPTGRLEHAQDVSAKKRTTVSYWARQVIVALCTRTTERGLSKKRDDSDTEDEPDLALVRKFVLEQSLKAFRDATTSTDSQELKYSKMLTLSDVFNSLLVPRPDQRAAHRGLPDEQSPNLVPTQKQIAKMMFEKGYLPALSAGLAEIDLTFDHAHRAVKYILRPLKLLTSTAVELSQTMDISHATGQPDEVDVDILSATSDTDYDEREETPDLFRNSTLGMFEPGREEYPSEESSDDEPEDEDEEMYEDRYADDMEFEEEDHEDIEFDDEDDDEDDEADENESDMDEEMGDAGPLEGLSGEVAMDVEIELDEGSSGDDSGDSEMESGESTGDDDDDDDDDEDGETYGETVENIIDVDIDDDDEHVIHEHEEEMPSDEDVPHISFNPGHTHTWDVVEDAANSHREGFIPNSALEGVVNDITERMIDGDPDDDGEDDSDDDGAEDMDDDYDEEDIMFDGPELDEDDIGQFPPLMSPRRHRHHHHHHHHHPIQFFPRNGMMDMHGERQSYRTVNSRPGASATNANENNNPLLDRGTPRLPNTSSHQMTTQSERERRFASGFHINLPGMRDLHRSIGDLSSLTTLIQALGGQPNILQAFQQHGAQAHGDGTVHLTLGSPLTSASLTVTQPSGTSRGVDPTGRSPRDNTNPFQALPFFPTPTVTRWSEEAKLLFGTGYAEQGVKVINSILKMLVPPAIEAEKVRKAHEAEQRQKDEERRKEEQLREEEERREREAAERARKEQEEREAAEAAAQAASQTTEPEESGSANPTEEAQNASGTTDAMEGVEASALPSENDDTNDQSSSQQTRTPVHITIRGRQLDVANLGIDLEYLEAIPEELREEVIIAQVTEQRSQQRSAGTEPSAINPEFLDALPPEIRDELLQQEAQERRRQEREEQRRRQVAAAGTQPTAEDIDPASFITSLDPHLRQTVLAEADEETLARLPQHLLDEARLLGGHRRTTIEPSQSRTLSEGVDLYNLIRTGGRAQSRQYGLSESEEPRGAARTRDRGTQQRDNKTQRRPIVQMLDKAAVAGLLRLMFFYLTGNARNSFNGIVQNAAGNRQTRGELVTGLLAILHEGSTDAQAVERCLAQLNSRAKQITGPKTPQSSKKPDIVTVPGVETTPLVVVGNCLSALVFLTLQVPHVSHFFLTEHDMSAISKSRSNRKGKGKESKSSRYPINALLALLDRSLIIQNSAIMEMLAGLLHSVSHPLNILLKRDKNETNEKNESERAHATGPTTDASATAVANAEASTEDVMESTARSLPAQEVQPETASEAKSSATESKKAKTLEAPEISDDNLRLVVNILTARECSSKTFQNTLSLMTNLSAIPTAKNVFGKELISRARELGQTIHEDLVQLVKSLRSVEDEMQAQSLALANFSPAGSDQAKLSRILTALDYLFDAKERPDQKKSYFPSEGDDLLQELIEDHIFSDLWHQLSSCLNATQRSDHYFFNVATILLPLIESLMVMCKRITLKEPQQSSSATPKDLPVATPGLSYETGIARVFITFTNRHKKILNDLVRHNPKLMSGSFSVLVKNPAILEFDNKRNFFTRRLHHRSMDMRQYPHPSLQLNVRRDQVFLDSYASLHFKSANEIKYGKLNIRFQNEEGVDAGGVTREWFQVLARQMFNAGYALFNPVASDRTTFHPNPLSGVNPEHLEFFRFIGRIIGKALYENRVLDCHFSRAVYKRLLGKPASLKDMETLDLDYTKSMEWILENSIDDVISETFSIVVDRFGKEEEIDLMPNGRNVAVTDDNKHEYVRLIVEHKLSGAVQEQLDSFLSGFYDIVPLELVSIFDEGELELLISGMPDVDVEDWKQNTEYHNYSASSPQVQWFWRAVRSFDKEERARLLQFVTGTGKVPLNGFKELEGMNGFTRFNIHKDYGNKDRLPSSHTCFNQLDLPEYENYETLRKQLYTAMTTGNEYFGFA